jgi:hypothetical protein
MKHIACLSAAVLLFSVNAAKVEQKVTAAVNPIRKVVTLLKKMQTKVGEEGATEKQLYDKFMCYCKTGASDLGSSVAVAEDKISTLPSEIEAAEAKLVQLKEGSKKAQAGRTAAKAEMAEATAVREKEAAAFASQKAEDDSNLAAAKKAIAAIEKGVFSGFLQTRAAKTLRSLVSNEIPHVMEDDRETLASFLSSTHETQDVHDLQILGILKQMADTMAADLTELAAAEEAAIKTYDELMAAKKAEVEALTASIESKIERIGELGVAIVEMKEDLTDTEAAYMADKSFLANLKKNCGTKTAEWEKRLKTRADELVALADTIKVLNDDDALDLFKKRLPSASASSFVQVTVTSASMRSRAMAELRRAWKKASKHHRPGLDFLVLALSGKKALSKDSFDKVTGMCDHMVKELKKEQQADIEKKGYCAAMFDVADDKKKSLERVKAGEEDAIAKAKEAIATLTEEVAELENGIVALDKSVVEATQDRKEENADHKSLMAADGAAKKLLKFAKNRLNQFYNPSLYVAPPKRELSAGDRIYENMGGEIPTEAPGGIADTGIAVFTQISAHAQQDREAPAPPPETWDAYSKKSEESTGVISMIDLLIKDLDKEMTEAEADEKNGQADYETMMKESAIKRTEDSKALAGKLETKADVEKALSDHDKRNKDASSELMATLQYTASLHLECDWLLQYFDMRKTARAEEIDSLVKAKAVLSGADYS